MACGDKELCSCGNPSGEVKTCSSLCCCDCRKPTVDRDRRTRVDGRKDQSAPSPMAQGDC